MPERDRKNGDCSLHPGRLTAPMASRCHFDSAQRPGIGRGDWERVKGDPDAFGRDRPVKSEK
jgi:hypothetical protein